jgi:hypothetical protein
MQLRKGMQREPIGPKEGKEKAILIYSCSHPMRPFPFPLFHYESVPKPRESLLPDPPPVSLSPVSRLLFSLSWAKPTSS